MKKKIYISFILRRKILLAIKIFLELFFTFMPKNTARIIKSARNKISMNNYVAVYTKTGSMQLVLVKH